MLWPYLYDLIFVAILALCIRRGWRNGLVSALLRLAGWVVAVILIASFAKPLANWTFDNLLRDSIVNTVNAALPQDLLAAANSGAAETEAMLDSMQDVLNSLGGILGNATVDTASLHQMLDLMQTDGMTLAQVITDNILRPVVISAVQVVLSMAFLVLSVWIFKILSRLSAKHRRRRGVTGGINSAIGAILGFCEGFAIDFIYAYLLSALANLAGDKLSFISQSIYNSTLLVHLLAK